jgi:hypothetical protein
MLKKTDVKPTDDVYLKTDCYPEVGAPGEPQQVVTVGVHKASEIPDFAWERGFVVPAPVVAKPVTETEPTPKPAKAKPPATPSPDA